MTWNQSMTHVAWSVSSLGLGWGDPRQQISKWSWDTRQPEWDRKHSLTLRSHRPQEGLQRSWSNFRRLLGPHQVMGTNYIFTSSCSKDISSKSQEIQSGEKQTNKNYTNTHTQNNNHQNITAAELRPGQYTQSWVSPQLSAYISRFCLLNDHADDFWKYVKLRKST